MNFSLHLPAVWRPTWHAASRRQLQAGGWPRRLPLVGVGLRRLGPAEVSSRFPEVRRLPPSTPILPAWATYLPSGLERDSAVHDRPSLRRGGARCPDAALHEV